MNPNHKYSFKSFDTNTWAGCKTVKHKMWFNDNN